MFNSNAPAQGGLLISEPFMLDLNFERYVVVLCEHNAEGTRGFVLNQRSSLLLSDVFDGVKGDEFPVYIGGPVHSNALSFPHRAMDKIGAGTPTAEDLYWGGDFERLMMLIDEHLITPDEVKFFVGYSG